MLQFALSNQLKTDGILSKEYLLWLSIHLLLGFIAFSFTSILTKKLGYYLERKCNPSRNILFAWLYEIGSDIRNLGRGLAYYFLISIPISIEFSSLRDLLMKGFQSYFVIIIGVFAVALLNVWEVWQIESIPNFVTDRDRKFLRTLFPLLANTGKYIVYGIGILSIFSVWGVNLTAVLGGAAIIAVIFGIAGQTILSDVLAGVFLIFERLYFVDSIIEVQLSDHIRMRGKVTRITWRITFLEEEETRYTIAIANRKLDTIRIIYR